MLLPLIEKEEVTLVDLRNGQSGFVGRVEGSVALRTHLEEMGFVEGQRVTRVMASPVGTPVVYAVMGEKVALRDEEARRISITEAPPMTLNEEIAAAEAETPASAMPETSANVTCHDRTEAEERGEDVCQHCGTSQSCPNCAPKQRYANRDFTPKQKGDITIALVGNPNCGKTAFFNAASGGHERTGNYAGVTVTSVVGDMNFEGRHLHIIDLPGTYSLRAFTPEEAYVAHEIVRGRVDVIVNVLDATNLERNLLLTLQLKRFGIPMVGALNMFDELKGSGSVLDIPALKERLGMELLPTVACRGTGVKEVLRAAVSAARVEGSSVNADAALREIRNGSDNNAAMNTRIRRLLHGVYELREGNLSRFTAFWDRWLVQSPLAYLFFLLCLWLIFQTTFSLGQYPMDWIDAGVALLQDWLGGTLPAGWFHDLIVQGVLGGVGTVIVFLPNILILYFLISLLEDSGYLARAATLADPLLAKAGLHGKSFIPMLMGFGCNVPAVMATRTIESRRSRLVTMAVIPFMSCSARIPVYLIFAGAFFPEHAGTVLFLLYVAGIVVAFGSALFLSRLFRKKGDSHFILEVPPYRRPMLKSVFSHTWERGREYLRKMSHVILLASVVIWVLQYFPRASADTTAAEQQEQSCLATVGKVVAPVFEPLGYNWQMTAGIITGVSAKELLVSTLGVLYSLPQDEADEAAAVANAEEAEGTHLAQRIREEGTSPAAALSFLVFALLYIPCIATIAAIRSESGRWKFALGATAYTFAVAYVLAFIVYRVALMWL